MSDMDMHPPETVLHAYLDGELPPAEKADLERHLALCEGCIARLKELQSLFSAISEIEEQPLDKDLSAAVIERLALMQPDLQPVPPPIKAATIQQGRLLVFQFVLAAIVLVASRSLLETNLAKFIPAPGWKDSFFAELLIFQKTIASGWAQGWQEITRQISEKTAGMALMRPIDFLGDSPQLLLGILLLIAFLLWLAGNRWLLKSRYSQTRHSHPSWRDL